MKKNILLIVPPYLAKRGESNSSKLRSFKAFPYGLLSVATYLKNQAGDKVNVQVLDCNFNDGRDYVPILKEVLKGFEPNIVGLSMMFDNSYSHINFISNLVKKIDKKIVVVLGGSAATSSYKTIIEEQDNIDAICFHEGELPFLKMIGSNNICEFLENDISWITKKSLNEGKIPQKTSIQNLDDIVNIDYSFIDVGGYGMMEAFSPFAGKIKNRKQFFLVTSRGCPFNCTFCIHSADSDKSIRYASVEAVINHVELLVERYKMNTLTIYDDQILLNKERAKQLFKAFAQFNLRIECPNGLSVAYMDEELIKLMREAGMDTVNLAIESGSPYVLNQIVRKPLDLKMVKPAVDILRKYNFWIHGFFVSGLPGETDAHRDETLNFIKEVGLDWSGFSLAIPTRGSKLFDLCIKNGYIKKSMKIDELDANKYIINTPGYSPEYIIEKTYIMNLDANFVNNHRMKNGEFKIAADAFRDVIKRYDSHAFAYYFLSKALRAMNEEEKAKTAIDEYFKILKKDNSWDKYIKYFNLPLN